MSKDDFEKLKNFTKSVVDKFGISELGPHLAVVEYGKEPTVKIYLGDHTDPKSLKEAIDTIEPSGSVGVATDKALEVAVKDVFSSENGGRPSVPNVVILLTDDRSTGDKSPEETTEDLEKAGVRVVVVGIGSNTNEDELKELVTKSGDLVKVENVGNVTNASSRVVDVVKQGTKESKWKR